MTFFDIPTKGINPFDLFSTWFDEAKVKELRDPNAMSLATVDANGRPSVRIVLLKEFDEKGFVFYTNGRSRKGAQLDDTNVAALCFYWKSMNRQIRIEGDVENVTDEESDAYFASRPRGSQIGAWASMQSHPLESRDELKDRVSMMEEKFKGDIPRPPHWHGYRVIPTSIEFWQEGEFRLHDRFVFEQDADGGWTNKRLYP